MKKLKILLSLILYLFNNQVFGYPIYFCKFITDKGKEIIIIGDYHDSLETKIENCYKNIFITLFQKLENLENKSIVLFEAPTKLIEINKICGFNIKVDPKMSTINGLWYLINNNNFKNITFKNCDIRTFTKEIFDILRLINNIESSSERNNFDLRKKEYCNKFKYTIQDYFDYFENLKKSLQILAIKHLQLIDIANEITTGLEKRKQEFEKLNKYKLEDSFFNLILEDNDLNKIKKSIEFWQNFLVCTDGYVTDLSMIGDILDSLDNYDTIVLYAGNRHASQIKLYFSKIYNPISIVGKTDHEDIQYSTPIELHKLNQLLKNEKNCNVCFKSKEEKKRCSYCKTTYYCSVDCQTVDWKVHQKNCLKKEYKENL